MRSIFLRLLSFFALGLMLLGFCSCSKGPSDNKPVSQVRKDPVVKPIPENPKPQKPEDFAEAIKIGQYEVKFSPLNQELAGFTTGTAFFKVTKTDFSVEVNIENSPVNTIHGQHIHMGNKCPGVEADVNADGVIDFQEAASAAGQIIIPLDGDIHSQLLDSYLFPVSDFSGMYNYIQSAPVHIMAEDLRLSDANIEDSMVKLGPEGKLNLENKVVMIYGVAEETLLPLSTTTFGSFSAQASLPIACGKITKANGAF